MNDSACKPTYETVVQRIARPCAAAGFDLIAPLCIGWYNDAVDAEYRVPDFGDPGSLAMVIGNTRALWPMVCRALDADAELAASADPVDRYTERAIRAAASGVDQQHEVRFAHEPPPRRVAMQRLAHVAGLAYLSPTYLSVHATCGPWIALRAVVVIAGVSGPSSRPELASPCDCASHCMPLFRKAMDALDQPDTSGVRATWRAWVAVRDACPVGREHRYSEPQIRYHYTKDRKFLATE